MGMCQARSSTPQIMLVGLDQAGKTSFMDASKKKSNSQYEATYGYKYQEKDLIGQGKVGLWDLGGKESIRPLWPSFYRNIVFTAVIFMIDAYNEDRLLEARRELHFLVNEEELREWIFLIALNLNKNSQGSTAGAGDESQKAESKKQSIESKLHTVNLHTSLTWKSFMFDISAMDDDYNAALQWLVDEIKKKHGN